MDIEKEILSIIEENSVNNRTKEEINNLIDQRLLFYKEENAKMEKLLCNLNLLNEDMEMHPHLKQLVENINIIKTKMNILTDEPEGLALAKADILNQYDNSNSKINILNNHYKNLNEKLEQKITLAEMEIKLSKEKLDNICQLSTKEMAAMEEKSVLYEKKLSKNKVKHSWLNNDEYDLIYIKKLVDENNEVAAKKATLEKELSYYKGLKPDIEQAKKQLLELKNEYYTKMRNCD